MQKESSFARYIYECWTYKGVLEQDDKFREANKEQCDTFVFADYEVTRVTQLQPYDIFEQYVLCICVVFLYCPNLFITFWCT